MITYLIVGAILGLMVVFGTLEAGECVEKEDIGVFLCCLLAWPIVILAMFWPSNVEE